MFREMSFFSPTILIFCTNFEEKADFTWAEDAWLLFSIPLFSDSLKERERNYKKIYAIDWALANFNSTVWDGHVSRALENMVYIHLRRTCHNVGYYLTRRKRQEVDFLTANSQGHPETAIQVSMDISQPDTLKREMEPLIAAAKYFNTKKNYILTYNQEKTISDNGITVSVLPIRKWLLGKE
ncbi:MAG: ATP-binding protein [Fibrobacteria bacterium]|nr:ATP-binding protein [Fibrobacteria bacterium]